MTDRNAELDALQRELRAVAPHIEKPDQLATPENGVCWITPGRMCGPDCVAFTDPGAATPAERCQALSSLTLLADQLYQLGTRNAVQGPATIPVPNPMGRKHE